MSVNKQYEYKGPVMKFDICVEQWWETTTWAPSEKKARSNIVFRYKRDNGLEKTAKITLPGKLIERGIK